MKVYSALVFLALVSLVCGATKKLPSYLQLCKRSDANYDSCTMKLIGSIRPQLAKGISQLQIPPLEPLVIPALQIDRDNEALQVSATLKNLKAYGASSFQINKFKSDLKNYVMELTVTLPILSVTTDFDVKGRLLVVPLNGKGVFASNITNTKADVKLSGKLVERRGNKYMEVVDVVSKINVGDSTMDFRGNSGRNDLISTSTTEFIQQNKQQVMDIIKPIVEETANAVIQQFANRFFGSQPYDTIVPP